MVQKQPVPPAQPIMAKTVVLAIPVIIYQKAQLWAPVFKTNVPARMASVQVGLAQPTMTKFAFYAILVIL